MLKPYFETENGKLYHGDCLEIMPQLEPVDLVVADPPYNFTTASAGQGKLNPWADVVNSALWFSAWIRLALDRTETRSGALWQCCNWRTVPTITKAVFDVGSQIESMLIWDKCWIGPGGCRGLRPSYEMVALMCHKKFQIKNRGIYDIQKFKWSSQKPTGHPAEKPLALMKWLIEISSCENAVVLDPFCGSGTTLVAAHSLGRRWIGVEMQEEYCEIASKRIEAETRQLKLFA